MQVRAAAGFETRYGEAETDHAVSIERSECLPAYLGRDHEQPDRQQLDIVETPDLFLQHDGVGKFLLRGERARDNRIERGAVESAHRLASCHYDSISSIELSRVVFPRSASFCST